MPSRLDLLDNFTQATIEAFDRINWVDISLEHTEYCVGEFLKKAKVQEAGGTGISWRVQKNNVGTARPMSPYDTDATKIVDSLVTGFVPWVFNTVNYSWSYIEPLFQSDRETIISELKLREHEALNSLVELEESQLWSAPTSTSTVSPFGIPFWIQKTTTSTDGAFVGGNPTGFTGGAAGIDSNAVTSFRNWAGRYTNVTSDDLVRKIKHAITKTGFMPPNPYPELAEGSDSRQVYTTYRVTEPLERLAETRNDRLGSDVARYMNQVTVGGVPLKYVPYLEANDTSDPVYGVNFRHLRPYVKRGMNMVRSEVKSARQHMMREVHIDKGWQIACKNRRAQWVLSK